MRPPEGWFPKTVPVKSYVIGAAITPFGTMPITPKMIAVAKTEVEAFIARSGQIALFQRMRSTIGLDS